MKRVVGMPGDWVVTVSPPKEDEEDAEARVGEDMFQVPEGHCWVAGDNLEWSRDSRIYGPVPLALVKGKCMATLWPWSQRKWFGEDQLQDSLAHYAS